MVKVQKHGTNKKYTREYKLTNWSTIDQFDTIIFEHFKSDRQIRRHLGAIQRLFLVFAVVRRRWLAGEQLHTQKNMNQLVSVFASKTFAKIS